MIENADENKDVPLTGKEDEQVNEQSEDFATPQKQEARAFLRERFLRVITGIIGEQTEFHLHENSCITAEFRGCDIDFLEVFVRNLNTPLGVIPEAILRTTDIIDFNVKDIKIEKT